MCGFSIFLLTTEVVEMFVIFGSFISKLNIITALFTYERWFAKILQKSFLKRRDRICFYVEKGFLIKIENAERNKPIYLLSKQAPLLFV